MSGRLAYLTAAAIVALWAKPVWAQAPFQVGQTVVAVPGFSDAACVNRGDLERYSSATDMCASGQGDECKVAKELETRGECGFHYGVYVVTSINASEGWIQISPQSDSSLSYWGQARDFSAAE